MTDRECARRKERYEDYKLAYTSLISCYPFELTDLDGEIWKKIAFGNGRYEISNYGRVKSFARGEWRILKPSLHNIGYLYIELNYKGARKKFKIHRLVAEAFIPNPENKATVDHVFNNKFDNYYKNLRWATPSENNQFAYDTGAKKSGGGSYQAKLTDVQAVWCRSVYNPTDTEHNVKALAEKLNVSHYVIWDIVTGKTYKRAEENVSTETELEQ